MVNLRIDNMVGLKKICAVAYLLILALHLQAQSDFCSARNTSFREGEKLTFQRIL